jgi:OmpA-OmpF porin, OOP family
MPRSLMFAAPSRYVVLVSVVGLVGCTGYSANPPMPGNAATEFLSIAAAKDALRNDGTFLGQLAREYYGLADDRATDKDWADADYFARKSLAASKGDLVPPEDNRNWGIPGQASLGTRDEIEKQRQRLVRALDGGGRDKYPKLAAVTQAKYDCWVERREASYNPNFKSDCGRQFSSDISDLEVLLHPPGPYHVYFPYNGRSLGPEAKQAVNQAAHDIPQDGTARAKIVGWADRSGSENYNMKLSDDRADAVRGQLITDGMAASRIDVTPKGESDPPVPTKDGVREPKNRVVEVYAEVPKLVADGDMGR